MLNNNKILILGSSGYIGSELIDALDLMGIKYAGLSRSANKKSTYKISCSQIDMYQKILNKNF